MSDTNSFTLTFCEVLRGDPDAYYSVYDSEGFETESTRLIQEGQIDGAYYIPVFVDKTVKDIVIVIKAIGLGIAQYTRYDNNVIDVLSIHIDANRSMYYETNGLRRYYIKTHESRYVLPDELFRL
jgi:hypothetical protein